MNKHQRDFVLGRFFIVAGYDLHHWALPVGVRTWMKVNRSVQLDIGPFYAEVGVWK